MFDTDIDAIVEAISSDKVWVRGRAIDPLKCTVDRLEDIKSKIIESDLEESLINEQIIMIDSAIRYRESQEYSKYHRISKENIDLYEINTSLPEGAKAKCPLCMEEFVKHDARQIFCSNAKTQGRHNCKDKFWNLRRNQDY